MRFAHTSTLSLVSVGLAWALAWGCAGKDTGSTFSTGAGSTGTTSGPTTSTTAATGTSSGTLTGTGTASTTTGNIGTGTGTGGAGGGGNINADAACGATMQGTKQIPIDVFIMQDKSGSMQCPATDDTCQTVVTPMPGSRWEAMGQALTTFVQSPTANGVGIGLGFFGLQDGTTPCTANSYATPVVPIAPLPGNAGAITAAIAATMPGGGTPTLPSLQGAINYAKAYTTMQMGARSAAVLFVTDGVPSGCQGNTVAAAAMAAQAAYMGTPQIKTFVVGMGDVAALDQIALAGSGGMTHYIPTMGDVVGTLTTALTAITGMVSCSYAIPPGSDPMLVNIQISIGMGGAPMNVGKVADMAACGALGGWYYDNPTKPTQIILCPDSCMPLQGTPNSGVQVLYGCPSMPPR